MKTAKQREDEFIEGLKKEWGGLCFESEQLLRFGFAAGADIQGEARFYEGIARQREEVLSALGIGGRKDFQPIEILGEPLSKTILKERR